MFGMKIFTNSTKSPIKDPRSFILPLVEPVKVTRCQDDCLHLQWQELAERIIIYAGTNPDDSLAMVPILSVSGTREAMVARLDRAVRHYFRLEFQGGVWNGRSLLAAERILPLQKGVNIRDAGGYHTRDGQMVRWGKLYRSGSMSRLSAEDQVYLQRMGVRLVYDLRSVAERDKRPDKLPNDPNLQQRHLPMESGDRFERLRGIYTVLFRKGAIDHFMLDGYQRVMIDSNAHLIGEIFQQLAEPRQLPAVLHCTAGKDRTGLVNALLLLTLGVPEETVLADYTLSNKFYDHFRAGIAADLKQVAPWGISIDDLQDLLLVKEKTLRGALDYLRQNYGSLKGYLHDAAGVSDKTISQLKTNWLI
jgi:protein-tyrosine phosphatase